jgi:hypothetical protein
MKPAVPMLLATLLTACGATPPPAPADPPPKRESIRQPGQAVDPVERAKGVEGQVLDQAAEQKKKIDEQEK